jgi:hypothetical protein
LKKRINWVKWADICKPKKEGGLGIKDVRLVNMSLLAKWRWKLLMEGDEVWKNVVVAKYGDEVLGNVALEVRPGATLYSTWWKDLCRLDSGVGWLNQVAKKKLGCGNSTKFWEDVWVGGQALNQRFPRLCSVSIQQDNLIQDMGSWVNGVWRWDLRWRRRFFVWEESLVQELEHSINQVVLTESVDKWVWAPNVEEGFSVKSLYVTLERILLPQNNLTHFECFAFNSIWKSAVPSKVSALAWQLFLDRIPTKSNLCRRGIIRVGEDKCSVCGVGTETARHLFLHCPFTANVWYGVNRWLGVMVVLPQEVLPSYGQLVGCGRNKRIRKGFSIVWVAFVWVIWKIRNDWIFSNSNETVEGALDLIQRLSWQWFLNKLAKSSCLFYEWIWNPGECMLR